MAQRIKRFMRSARRKNRLLVTLDLDFSNVLSFPPEGTPGLVVLRGPNQLFPIMRILVETLIDALTRESSAGRLWIVKPGRLRIHEETGKDLHGA